MVVTAIAEFILVSSVKKQGLTQPLFASADPETKPYSVLVF